MPAGRPKPKIRAASMPNRKMPTGLPMINPPSTIQVGSPKAENTTPAFRQAKEEQHHLDKPYFNPMFDHSSDRSVQLRLGLGKKAVRFVGMWHRRHDGQQAQAPG